MSHEEHRNPTGQNSPLVSPLLLASKQHFQSCGAPFGQRSCILHGARQHQESITRTASPGEHHQDSSISVPSDPKFRAGSWPQPPGKGPEGLQREGKRRLGGTLARNRGLKINEGSVLSSELTETERTHADLC